MSDVVHGGMPYAPIQGQGQGHMALKVSFKIYLVRHFQWGLANDCLFLKNVQNCSLYTR